jgi:4-methyl-5(b-hydroxyethyl)-thiazole monophosphate biosynthesis
MARVLVPLADGFEEVEAVTIIDLLRRADIDVVTAALADRRVTGNHGITIEADTTLDAALDGAAPFDMVALPGGLPGARHLQSDPRVLDALRAAAARGAYTAAICAAPIALAEAGLLRGRRATSFPGFLDTLDIPGMERSELPVVTDGTLVTSRGPGTAMEFALTLIELLTDQATRERVAGRLQRPADH